MIDKLRDIAVTLQFLRYPLIAFGLLCLSFAAYIVLESTGMERYLIPNCVGLLWAMSAYFFIETFRSAPDKADETLTFFGRLKRRLHRAWYWIIAMVFLSATLAALYVTNKMISIWLKDFGG